MRKPIYIETTIQTDIETLWAHTQNPEQHEKWDLRFSKITYLPRTNPDEPQRFHYETRIGFGLSIHGTGESVGKVESGTERASALRFWTDHPLSLIGEGSGYWKYVETDAGIRFITQYDYKPRFGAFGKIADLVFRPLMRWGTAWSFDRLKLWLEKGISPQQSFVRSAVHTLLSAVLAFIWMYQGLVPKILFPEYGERALLAATGLFPGVEDGVLLFIGTLQILFGALILRYRRQIWVHAVNIFALISLGMTAVLSDPTILAAPMNPTTLTVAMIGCSVSAVLLATDLPSAGQCIQRRQRAERKYDEIHL
ncbi:MAG: DoxX-like family protein [Bacilli bacterium]